MLVVDDSRTMRLILVRALQSLGFHNITEAKDGREALDLVHQKSFDLMLLDLEMPEMNGLQVLQAVKGNPQFRELPVIVISGAEQMENAVQCIEAGAEDYLPKPFHPTLLRARVSTSIEKKRLRDLEKLHLAQLQEEKQRSDDLLHVILPRDVAAELKATQNVKPRCFERVGILFSDIVAFTSFSEKHRPEVIHAYLQSQVEQFELLTAQYGLEKIKTAGDSFMAAAGLSVPLENPALHCVRCGLAMIAASHTLPPHWQVRVGVHAGPVVAGVVGRKKYQYDVWGDTVNTAARMERAGTPGGVCVSAETWHQVKAYFQGELQGRVEVKGKGEMEIYRIHQAL